MAKKPNIDLIEEKIKNVKTDVDRAQKSVDDLEQTVKNEYTTISTTNGIDKRVKKFESIWDWVIKIILAALIGGILALLGLGAK